MTDVKQTPTNPATMKPASMKATTVKPTTVKPSLRVYNTLSRQKEPFETVETGKVGMYLCGPTVYKEAHIGHMVGPVVFDCIKRYLTYNGYEVNWVVNITDVDDKLIGQSKERGIPMSQIATEMTMDYCANLMAMGVDQISSLPRATDHMDEIISFISNLVEKEFAYEVEGDVFFDCAKDDQYGKLSNRRADDQQGEGGEAGAKKRSPGDFALWKNAKRGEPAWQSPWGQGRPGWHIECSAMSRRILGETFDIHGGGLDLIFPHHENEVAQSECCHGKPMARYWMHNGLLRSGQAGKLGGRADREAAANDQTMVDDQGVTDDQQTGNQQTGNQQTGNQQTGNQQTGNQQTDIQDATEVQAAGKMSRSKGAGGLRSLIGRLGGECIRFFLLRTHYRSTIVFSEQAVAESGVALDKFYTFFERYQRINGRSFYLCGDSPQEDRAIARRRDEGDYEPGNNELLVLTKTFRDDFLARMDDDFNSGGAVSVLFQLVTELNKFAETAQLEDPQNRQVECLAAFNQATETLRELSAVLGLFLKPPAQPSGGDSESVVDGLMAMIVELRANARASKDFATADLIRDKLTELEILLEDRKGETSWKLP